MDDNEIKDLLKAILHRVEVTGAKVEAIETRLQSVEAKVDGLAESVARIEGHNLRQERLLNDHNHRIADIEQEMRISKQ